MLMAKDETVIELASRRHNRERAAVPLVSPQSRELHPLQHVALRSRDPQINNLAEVL